MPYRGHWDRLQFYVEDNGTTVQLIDKELNTMKYRLTLGVTITDTSKPAGSNEAKWFGPAEFPWHNLDDVSLPYMLGLANSVITEAEKQDNEGGPLQALFTNKVETMDGSALPSSVPPGANGARTFSGVTRHGVVAVQKAMLKIGEKLVKEGEKHADHKEGKPKP